MSNERITLDLSGTDDATKNTGDFPVLPKGWYEVAFYEVEQVTSKAGNEMYKVQLRVTEGDYTGRVQFDNIMLEGKALWKIEQVARALGTWDGVDRSKVTIPTAEEMQGELIEASLKRERDNYAEEREGDDWDGTPIFRNSVTAYRPVGGWPKDGAPVTKKAGTTAGLTL